MSKILYINDNLKNYTTLIEPHEYDINYIYFGYVKDCNEENIYPWGRIHKQYIDEYNNFDNNNIERF